MPSFNLPRLGTANINVREDVPYQKVHTDDFKSLGNSLLSLSKNLSKREKVVLDTSNFTDGLRKFTTMTTENPQGMVSSNGINQVQQFYEKTKESIRNNSSLSSSERASNLNKLSKEYSSWTNSIGRPLVKAVEAKLVTNSVNNLAGMLNESKYAHADAVLKTSSSEKTLDIGALTTGLSTQALAKIKAYVRAGRLGDATDILNNFKSMDEDIKQEAILYLSVNKNSSVINNGKALRVQDEVRTLQQKEMSDSLSKDIGKSIVDGTFNATELRKTVAKYLNNREISVYHANNLYKEINGDAFTRLKAKQQRKLIQSLSGSPSLSVFRRRSAWAVENGYVSEGYQKVLDKSYKAVVAKDKSEGQDLVDKTLMDLARVYQIDDDIILQAKINMAKGETTFIEALSLTKVSSEKFVKLYRVYELDVKWQKENLPIAERVLRVKEYSPKGGRGAVPSDNIDIISVGASEKEYYTGITVENAKHKREELTKNLNHFRKKMIDWQKGVGKAPLRYIVGQSASTLVKWKANYFNEIGNKKTDSAISNSINYRSFTRYYKKVLADKSLSPSQKDIKIQEKFTQIVVASGLSILPKHVTDSDYYSNAVKALGDWNSLSIKINETAEDADLLMLHLFKNKKPKPEDKK